MEKGARGGEGWSRPSFLFQFSVLSNNNCSSKNRNISKEESRLLSLSSFSRRKLKCGEIFSRILEAWAVIRISQRLWQNVKY